MNRLIAFSLFGSMSMALLPSAASAQTSGAMTLVLLSQDHSRSSPLTPLAATLIVARSDATSGDTVNKLDLVFDSRLWADQSVLRWLARSKQDLGAVFTVIGDDRKPITYTLTGITLRSATMTQQGGNSQASFIIGASHVRVGDVVIN